MPPVTPSPPHPPPPTAQSVAYLKNPCENLEEAILGTQSTHRFRKLGPSTPEREAWVLGIQTCTRALAAHSWAPSPHLMPAPWVSQDLLPEPASRALGKLEWASVGTLVTPCFSHVVSPAEGRKLSPTAAMLAPAVWP